MKRPRKPFGKRTRPILEFKVTSERVSNNRLSERRVRSFAIYATPAVLAFLTCTLVFLPESRAFALNFGKEATQWLLRGLLP